MAPPPKGRMHPSRYLAVLGCIFVVMYALVFLTGPGTIASWHERIKPTLGLDLVGGTTLTLTATTPDGKAPSKTSLEEARNIIEQRVNGLGIAEPQVVTEGSSNIVVTVAGKNSDAIKQVGKPAQLRFRKVLNATSGAAPKASKSPSPSPSASGTASASPSASGSASPSPSPSTTSPTPTSGAIAGTNEKTTLAKVKKKLGDVYTLAEQAQSPDDVTSAEQQYGPIFSAFGKLTPAEVGALPAKMQFNIPDVTCKQLNARPAGVIDAVDKQAVACQGNTKFLLDKAKVVGTDVKNASAAYDSQGGQGWLVQLSFTGNGQNKWTNLTKEAYNNTAKPTCEQAAMGQDGHCRVAVVLDTRVVSAPEIQSVITGQAQITGSFSQDQADTLANQLKYGALPLTFQQADAQQISATLGQSQLVAGLIAAAIGLAIVVLYALFYYRLLGIVIFLSLVLSGLLVYAALVLLGRGLGLTLSLAGFAGFVVSLGVAADSFVIYFERLKDEIRDGRTARSAVPRAWARARRTIISANAITILCAGVLYFLSIGSVQGFAFALGLATLLDLLVVFLFRHPIMTLFARSKAFLSPRVSGLGRVLEDPGKGGRRGRRPGRTAAKEA